MTSAELRQKFLDFYVTKGHKKIPSAILVPENDPTTLFTSSGMQQLVPYLKGEIHPMGKRLVNSQPSFRAEDIEEVGDNRHTTFFEMLGNWSLGDYFKQEQLVWLWEFLTKVIGLNPDRLYITVFGGDKKHKVLLNNKQQPLGPDVESINIWRNLLKFDPAIPVPEGIKGFDKKIKIYEYDVTKNWWSRSGEPAKMPIGEIGGPDSEVFYDFGADLKIHEKSPFKDQPCHLNCNCGRFLEIGNSVFMQYEKIANGLFRPLPNKNVDFGGGLERILAAKENKPDVFKTELFWPIIQEIEKACDKKYEGNENAMRVIADHLKAAVFMAKAGVEPSNKKQGYIMRRLIRRSVVKIMQLDTPALKLSPKICQQVVNIYKGTYLEEKDSYRIGIIIGEEINRFLKNINKTTKLLQTRSLSGKLFFDLEQSYGMLFEISQELLKQWGKSITKKSKEEYRKLKEKHQQLSRTASKGMFKGGLADHSEKITKLHTATHLLHAALRKVLGNHVKQVGSNITAERLRFDFTHHQVLTNQEIKQIEELVNQQIKNNLKIECQTMTLAAAQRKKALAFFGQKYPEKVKVYRMGSFSKEVCAGPHFDFTGTLGKFKIKKEKSCGSCKRRIYGELE